MKDLIRRILYEQIMINEGRFIKQNLYEQMPKLTTDEFIEKAKQVHGNRFSYDKTEYTGAFKPVIITCPDHGDFLQRASSHLGGNGCRKCADELRVSKFTSNTNEFIDKAKQVHGDKYSYDKTQYIKGSKPVIITCPKHGDFPQSPTNHLSGGGCAKCVIESKTGSTDEFIEKAKQVHGNRYSYDKTQYTLNHKPVIITCSEHGDFPQAPSNHLSGAGCPKCAERLVAQKQTSNTEEFINKAKKVHGDKYTYDNVDYKKSKEDVIITCPKLGHGDFLQQPNTHLLGSGCPKCSESKGELIVTKILNTLKIQFVREKKFEDCKGIGKYCRQLKFDFYLPEFNSVIEYDGKQHFEIVKRFGGEETFKKIQINDEIKNKYCKDNGIKMIRIPYTIKFDDIIPLLKNELGITG
jgi:hypothetical protein